MKKTLYLMFLLSLVVPVYASAALIAPRVNNNLTTTTKVASTTVQTNVDSARVQMQVQPIDKLDPQPEPPNEINKLDPQPEPPARIQVQGVDRLDPQPEPPMIDKLDPQPEPPMTGLKIGQILNSNSEANGQAKTMSLEGYNFQEENNGEGKVLKFQKSNETSTSPLSLDNDNYKFNIIGKKITIATNILDFSEMGDKTPVIEVKLRNSSSSAPNMVKLKLVNNNALMNFGQGEGQGQITLRSDFEVQAGKIVLINGENKLELQQNPPSFYRGLEKALEKKGRVEDVELKVENNKPVYEIRALADAKLLGFIPMPIETRMRVGADDNQIKLVEKPWYAIFYTNADISDMLFKPDFVVTNIELPASFKKGDNLTAKITITNEGTATGLSLFNTKTGVCHEVELYWDNYFIKKTCLVFAIGPGESYTFEQKFEAQCKPIKAHFDPAQSLEDSNYGNNSLTVQTNCSE